MKHALPLLLLAACAAPPTRTPKADPLPPLPYAFHVNAAGELVLVREAIEGEPPTEAWLDAVRALVAPDSWKRGALFVDGKNLLIRNTAAVCDTARDVLAAIRSADQRVFTVSTRILRVTREQLSDLRNLDVAEGALAGRFDRDTLTHVIADWSRDGAELFAAPKLSVHAGQPGQIVIATQLAYIQGWERTHEAWDPVVSVLNDGLALTVVAAPNGGRQEEVALALSLQASTFLDPAPKMLNIRFEDRMVEMPGVATTRTGGRFAVSPKDALLLVARNPDRADDKRPLLAIVVDVR